MSEPNGSIFRPIRDRRHHEAVIDQITFAIRAGKYKVGDKLPSLDELCRLMAVSRPVVSAAVRTLSVAGVLVAQRGNSGGLWVATNNIPAALLGLTNDGFDALPAILEARRAVEVKLALLCAQRATEDDFDEMEHAILQFVEHQSEGGEQRRDYDHLFHYCMARAARSEMLAYYQHQILERLAVLLEDYFEHDEQPEMVERLHRETLAALRSRDEAAVVEAIDRHLRPLEEAFAVDPQSKR